jgi:hypothetical protein
MNIEPGEGATGAIQSYSGTGLRILTAAHGTTMPALRLSLNWHSADPLKSAQPANDAASVSENRP